MSERYSPPSAARAGGAPLGLRDAAIPLVMIGVFVFAGAVTAIARVAAGAAAPPGWVVPAWGAPMLKAVFDTDAADLDPLIGPDGSRWAFWLVAGILTAAAVAVIGVPVWWIQARVGRAGDPSRALAGRREQRDMHGKGAERRAQQLRPSLAGRPVAARDLGLRLGRADPGGYPLYASEEDVGLVIAGPRSNKTSALVVPAILTAPGPVIATSNKVDVFALTGRLRAERGEVFVLDPQAMTGVPQSWWFNPLRWMKDIADARRFVDHFVATVGGGNDRADPYFTPAAARLLSQYTLAAACSGHHLRTVRTWLADRSDEPAELLHIHGFADAATGVEALLAAPDDQKGGVFETALTALSSLESEAVARYVTPPSSWVARAGETLPDPGQVREFDPWQFLVGYNRELYLADSELNPENRGAVRSVFVPTSDTLYALTREGAGTAAPVVAALVDHLLLTASTAATVNGGRVDPPLRVVLDEAANICPIGDLPDLYSYFGSMSIQVISFLQSEAQAIALWGKSGADKLWSSATFKMIGASVHDSDFCEKLSRIVGQHDVPTWSDQHGRGGGSVSRSFRRDAILSAADIAALPKTHALLFTAGRRPGIVALQPWYTEPESEAIRVNEAHAVAEIRGAAIAALGPDNALAQHLARENTARDAR